MGPLLCKSQMASQGPGKQSTSPTPLICPSVWVRLKKPSPSHFQYCLGFRGAMPEVHRYIWRFSQTKQVSLGSLSALSATLGSCSEVSLERKSWPWLQDISVLKQIVHWMPRREKNSFFTWWEDLLPEQLPPQAPLTSPSRWFPQPQCCPDLDGSAEDIIFCCRFPHVVKQIQYWDFLQNFSKPF